MIKTEPVASTGAFAVILGALVQQFLPGATPAVQAAVVTVLTAGFVVLARRFSFSENTIRDAGLDPASVERRAADPTVPRCEA